MSVEPEEIASKRPESLRQLIEGQLDRLSAPEQRILEAAAVVGSEFTARSVAAALETDTIEVEERCEGLVRQRQFLDVVNPLRQTIKLTIRDTLSGMTFTEAPRSIEVHRADSSSGTVGLAKR